MFSNLLITEKWIFILSFPKSKLILFVPWKVNFCSNSVVESIQALSTVLIYKAYLPQYDTCHNMTPFTTRHPPQYIICHNATPATMWHLALFTVWRFFARFRVRSSDQFTLVPKTLHRLTTYPPRMDKIIHRAPSPSINPIPYGFNPYIHPTSMI